MKLIGIIPARSGSKGLKDKNIRALVGKPLLAYTIQAAQDSGIFDEIMVSTDSEKYAEIAREWGANVPFLRSVRQSSDTASSWDVVKEVLERYVGMGKEYDSFCLLQPTSPLRSVDDIRKAYEIFLNSAIAVISLCEVEHSPLLCNRLPEGNSLKGFIQKGDNKQRQAAGKFYRINGAIYFVKINEFYKDDFLYREGSYGYIMPKERSIDIDTELDFRLAETMMGGVLPK